MKKRSLLLGLVTMLCASFAMVGCSSDDKKNETESQSETKEEKAIIGYWESKMSEDFSAYYAIEEDKMEALFMGMTETCAIELTDSEIKNLDDEEESYTYSVEGDVLTLTSGEETLTLSKISKEDYEAAKSEAADNADDSADADDDSINGYSVEPGVEMTVTEDDGTVVVYANDGDGTYIKSKTKPEDMTSEEQE